MQYRLTLTSQPTHIFSCYFYNHVYVKSLIIGCANILALQQRSRKNSITLGRKVHHRTQHMVWTHKPRYVLFQYY